MNRITGSHVLVICIEHWTSG